MAGENVLSEALDRVEHKVDLVLELLTRLVSPSGDGTFLLTPVGDSKHICPVCTKNVGYQVDFFNKVVVRVCGCSTGKLPPADLGMFAPPVIPNRKENDNGGDEEDRSNPSRGGSGRK